MSLSYGYVKAKVAALPHLKGSRHRHETQYHLHVALDVATSDGGGATKRWDSAINVGTDDSDDLLRYKLVYDFHHSLAGQLAAAPPGSRDLTGTRDLPALDFLRSDLLAETSPWRDSDVMDGTVEVEPVASLMKLLSQARQQHLDVYLFGRFYKTGGPGIHDIHMNQGSRGSFLNNGADDHNDHNDTWQDGAVLVDLGQGQWAGYFTAFTQQAVPTDDLGNPTAESHPVEDSDTGSMAPLAAAPA